MVWKLQAGSAEPVYLIDPLTQLPYGEDGGGAGIIVRDEWELVHLRDAAADDSNKDIVVPAGYEYQVLAIHVLYISTVTVGTRQLWVAWYDDFGNLIGQIRPGGTQAASLTRYYEFAPGLADLTSFRDTTFMMTPLPSEFVLQAGFTLRVLDATAVDPFADDMTVDIMLKRRAV